MKIEQHKNGMFLRQHIAEGEIEGNKFDVALHINGSCVIFNIYDGKGGWIAYTIGIRDLFEEVLKFREAEKEKEKT
jgi:hypothetical protein